MPRNAARTSLRYHVLTAVLVGVGILLTVAGFFLLLDNEHESTRKTFERAAADQADLIEQGIQRHIDALHALGAFYGSSQEVTREEFHSFTEPLLARSPGIQALGWAPLVSTAQRSAYEQVTRRRFPAFEITEHDGTGLVRAGVRSEYFPVYFVEPYAGNEAGLGYDLASDAERRKTLEMSQASGLMAATGRVTLIHEPQDPWGVLLFQPIYARDRAALRGDLLGFVFAMIKPKKLIATAIHDPSPGLDITLHDETAPPAKQLLFSASKKTGTATGSDIGLVFSDQIVLGGRHWVIKMTPANDHYSPAPSVRAWWVLVIGLAFSALIGLCLQIIRARVLAAIRANQALDLAHRNLATTQRIAQLGSWEIELGADGTDRHVRWSDEVYRLLGYEPGEIELSVEDYFRAIHPADRERLAEAKARRLDEPGPATTEYRIIRGNGEVRIVLCSSQIVYGEDGTPQKIIGTSLDITERHQRQQELQRFRAALDASTDAIMLADRNGRHIIDVNETACRMFGYARAELLRMKPVDISTRMDDAALAVYYDHLVASGVTEVMVGKARRKDGSLVPVEACISAREIDGTWVVLVTFRDISERLFTERIIAEHAKHQGVIAALGQHALESKDLAALLQHAVEMIAETLQVDCCNVTELEPGGQHLRLRAQVGMPESWFSSGGLFPIPPGSRSEQAIQSRQTVVVDDYEGIPLYPQLADFRFASGMLAPIHGAGGIFGLAAVNTLQPRRFSAGEAHFLQSATNVLAAAMARHSAEQKLSYLAQFDSLTGLPNRHMFHDQLTRHLAQHVGDCVGCMFVDLDRFKYVNDTFGHAVGDLLLVQAAKRLRQCIRNADLIGRLGGDEFAVLLGTLTQPEDASVVAQKILEALVQPFDLEGHQAHISTSIGIALFPDHGDSAEALLRNADAAMYLAKEQGRNAYQFYLPQLNERALQRQELENSLHGALARQEFVLFYQPKVDLVQGAISGFEALLRWRHPERGIVSPIEFISALEDTGLIVPVGEWVLQTVCRQIKDWQAQGVPTRPIAINISAKQYQQQHLGAMITMIREIGVDPSLLKFELTESLLMHNVDDTNLTLGKLKAAGVRLSVDDFGTGYSSLAYLKRFPLDEIKIDRAFIRDVSTDPDDAEIVTAVIRLAHSLRLRVVAEGVETEAQLNFLRFHGCDEIQGYYFAEPMEIEACTPMLVEDRHMAMPQDSAAEAPGVLVVDDDPNDLLFLKRALERESYRVLLAENPRAAFDLLSMHRVDVIISDNSMPGMNGVEFLSRVRKLYPEVVRIVLSGSGDMRTVTNAVNEAGIQKFLSKDVDMALVIKEVRDSIRRRQEMH